METSIFLNDLEFFGKHGVYQNEHRSNQRFTISVEIYGNFLNAMQSDELKYTVNYSTVYTIIKQTVEDNNFLLIEKLAYTISQNIFQKFESAQKIYISIKKFPISWSNKSYGNVGFSTTISR